MKPFQGMGQSSNFLFEPPQALLGPMAERENMLLGTTLRTIAPKAKTRQESLQKYHRV